MFSMPGNIPLTEKKDSVDSIFSGKIAAMNSNDLDTTPGEKDFNAEGVIHKTALLHNVVLNEFHTASNGEVYEKDTKDAFSMLIIGLELKAIKPKRFMSLTKTFPYSFACNTAIEKMKDLSITIELSRMITHISYKLQPEVSLSLISRFYKAKFLHCPADRTANELVASMVLQPTPKGLAIVQEFCQQRGMRRNAFPDILRSSFNTMELFFFERDWESDKILYSKYLLHLLFSNLMGPKPNVWSSNNEQDPLPSSKAEDHRFSVTEFQVAKDYEQAPEFSFVQFQTQPRTSSAQSIQSSNDSSKKCENEVSPFYNRYFTNPESDAHIQYYVSSVGVRLFKDKTFHLQRNKNLVVDYSMSGKAINQWLLDCTDIINVRQAGDIGELLLKNNLITEITLDKSSDVHFSSDRNSYYTVTDFGLSVCQWRKSPNFECPVGSKKPKTITLDEILKDPGFRLQFRKHLSREYCLENLEAYMQLKHFDKLFHDYERLLKFVHEGGCKDQIIAEKADRRLHSLRKSCFSLAYSLYVTYLSDDAPFVVNIAYKLKSSTIHLFTGENDNITVWLKQIDTDDSKASTLVPLHEKTTKLLSDTSVLFTQVSNYLYRLMEVDSLPKFLKNISKRNSYY